MTEARVGLVGCGVISATYLRVLAQFPNVEVVACADLDLERARARAEEFGVPWASSVEELLADPGVDVVLNLTPPRAHAVVSIAALEAAKHVYQEKPLGATREEGTRILAAAERAGRRVGCAPDTFLGAALQTARALIDEGAIGEPVAAAAHVLSRGHEGWHPDPAFYYRTGGGPLLDMGPYYLTALVSLLGPVRRVSGSARASFPTRLVTSRPRAGEVIEVEVPTHCAGVLDFENGAVGTLVTSFDVWAESGAALNVYGAEGTLALPDPDEFGGTIQLLRPGSGSEDVPLTAGFADESRGLGLAEMADAIAAGRPHRASGELAFHVLDVAESLYESSLEGRHREIASGVRPEALPAGWRPE